VHFDLDQGGPERLFADVAIIGAGVAGITVARRLLAGGLSVVLLESGGLDYEQPSADLNAGDNAGLDYYPLDQARLRMFGGTTAIWGGRCAALDEIDLQRRDWVPHSGWPIRHDELQRYTAQARQGFGLPASLPDAATVRAAGVPLPAFSHRELDTPLWMFDEQFDRFSFARCADLVDHPHCTIVSHATVREIVASSSGAEVRRLDVGTLGGRRMDVVACDYVLAAGGIENPRLLVASNAVCPAGLGNGHDQVGRYFMEHPHARGGRIVGDAALQLFQAFAKRRVGGVTVAPLIRPSPDLQRREGLLNTSMTIAPRRPAMATEAWAMRAYLSAKHRTAPNRLGRTLWKLAKKTVGKLQYHTDPWRPLLLNRLGRLDVALVVRAEQAPNPDSRIMLSAERDAMGVQRVTLDWRTCALDVDSVAGMVAALGRETARLGLGRVEPAQWLSDASRQWVTDALISAHPIGGYHHMGTTRMADDPRRGVTDGHGQVHGIHNLHVAGSSLFPTSGWANPTLTIAALGLRLSDRLVDRAARGGLASVSSITGRRLPALVADAEPIAARRPAVNPRRSRTHP
jgi:choline dehydrogenase-like flavoprotein